MDPVIILKKIIDKGGVIGTSGKLYVKDKYLASKYIIECREQLHPNSCVFSLWGKELVKEITDYDKKLKKAKLPPP